MYAQKQFTLEDLNFGGTNYRNMVPANRWMVWWGDKPVHLEVEKVSVVNTATGQEQLLFTLDALNDWIGCDDQHKVRALYNASFPYADKPWVLVECKEKRMLVDFRTHKVVFAQTVNAEDEAVDFNTVSRNAAYIRRYNLYVRTADGQEKAVSTDGSRQLLYGTSVHRDEFGYTKGTFWSADGKALLFTKQDQSAVADYPLVDIPEIDWRPEKGESRMAKAAPEKYPMVGETSHKVYIGIYHVSSGKTVYLQTGNSTDRYFTNPAWSPDGSQVYLFELNRDQNDCRLVVYDANTGKKVKELYRETDDKYVEPLHPVTFLPWDNTRCIMQSRRDGYNHLYVLNVKNGDILQLTNGSWEVMELMGFDAKTHTVFYAGNEVSPLQRNLWCVNADNGKRMALDNGKGWHRGVLSASGRYLVDNWQEPDVPRKIAITKVRPYAQTTYFEAPDPWNGYAVPQYLSGSIKAADGQTDLYYRMVLPVGFRSTEKYPTIIYVYGGPHAHNVDAGWHWASRGWETYMAQKGYLLFILDNRGSENRGKAFEQTTFRHLGQYEVEDQMKGVDYLKSLSYVDTTRIGVHGWSFGGFMTCNLMLTHPEVFKVGVAGGPVIDWKWYEAMYGERYMDTPAQNPEGYAMSSLLPKAKALKGRLQIIIGTNDPVVLPQHALSFLKACIGAGTQPDFFVYPGEPHNMRGHQSTHLHERISRYFDDYLK